MSTAREQAEQEARAFAGAVEAGIGEGGDDVEALKLVAGLSVRHGFIAGRTVSAGTDEAVRDAISAALLALPEETYDPHEGEDHPHIVTNIADAAYEAAGLIVEEAD